MSGFVIQFLTREGCHLCADALPQVMREVERLDGSVVVTDVDTVLELQEEFGTRVPIVLGPGGEVLAEGDIDRHRLRSRLRRL